MLATGSAWLNASNGTLPLPSNVRSSKREAKPKSVKLTVPVCKATRLPVKKRSSATSSTASFSFRAPSRRRSFLVSKTSGWKLRVTQSYTSVSEVGWLAQRRSPHCQSELRTSDFATTLLSLLSRCGSWDEAQLPSELSTVRQLVL